MSQRSNDHVSESSVARIAGNIAGAIYTASLSIANVTTEDIAIEAVRMARAIAAEVKRTEPEAK